MASPDSHAAAARQSLAALDERMREFENLPPLSSDLFDAARRSLRVLADHHSSAIEGNTLTLGETVEYLRSGTRPVGKPEREVMEIRGHDEAVAEVEGAIRAQRPLTEDLILGLHRTLMAPVVEHEEAVSGLPPPPSRPVGAYKKFPNSVMTSAGEKIFTLPADTPAAMRDLLSWSRSRRDRGTHAVTHAAEFHCRFVRIHPFYDGNGRTARLLMNFILRQNEYPEAVIRVHDRDRYLGILERSEAHGDDEFTAFVADYSAFAADLYLRCGRGEPVGEPEEIDLEIAAFRQRVLPGRRPGGRSSSRDSAETLLFPFFRHFRTRLEQLFDCFSENDLSLEVSGVEDSAESFTRNFRSRFDLDDLPARSRITLAEVRWVARRPGALPGSAGITAQGRPSEDAPGAWDWIFRSNGRETQLQTEESSTGAKTLQMQFNDELRRVMKACED